MALTIQHQSYLDALARAERRARHSLFDQHVIEDPEQGYIVLDEGDYFPLPSHLVERIVHSVGGARIDEM